MKFKDEFQVNEANGILNKVARFLIKNVDFIQKAYINDQKKYGIKHIKVTEIEKAQREGTYMFLKVTDTKNKDYLCMVDVSRGKTNQMDHAINRVLQGDKDVKFSISPMPDMVNNGITPYLVLDMQVGKI